MDIIKWLRETGGNNAIERFSTKRIASQSTDQKQAMHSRTSQSAATYAPSTQQQSSTMYNQSAQFNDTDSQGNRITMSTNKTSKALVENQGVQSGTSNVVKVSGKNNFIHGYNGYQSDNSIEIAGNTNKVLSGGNTIDNEVKMAGHGNSLLLSDGASKNLVDIRANNVNVSIGMAGATTGANTGWKIQVAVDSVDVSISNGKAKVTVSEQMRDKVKIEINEKNKTVLVNTIA